jgi:large subunit ribosomal protein L2
VGDTVTSGPGLDIKPGNALRLATSPSVPSSTPFELQPGQGRGAGSQRGQRSIQLMAKEGRYAILRMPSSEMRRVLVTCRATIGEVGNSEHEHQDRQGRSQPLDAACARPFVVRP